MKYTFPHNSVISNEGLNQLQRTFDDWCNNRLVKANREEADDAASRLMVWYQLGITDPDQLSRLMNAI